MHLHQIWTVEQARQSDEGAQQLGVAFLSLMEVAGAKAAAFFTPRLAGKSGLVLCGKGHNGGDGLVAARYLAHHKSLDICFPFGEPQFEGASGLLRAAVQAGARTVSLKDAAARLSEYFWVVDGLFGTGFHGKIDHDEFRQLWDAVAQRAIPVAALDILSGVNADDGHYEGPAVQVDSTVTFGAAKWGHFSSPGVQLAGELAVADIGLPTRAPDEGAQWISPAWAKRQAPAPDPFTYKYRRGRVAVVGGSRPMPGAPVLSGLAALRAGAGLVQLIVPADAAHLVPTEPALMVWPSEGHGELTVSDIEQLQRADVIVWGPGMGPTASTQGLDQVIALGKPLVIDADGLGVLGASGPRPLPPGSVLTPHSGEMGKLLQLSAQQVDADRREAFAMACKRYGASVILKGPYTIAGLGHAYVNTANTPALATAGSGDVLSGIVAALLAAPGARDPSGRAALACYLHGWAGIHAERNHGAAVIATDIIGAIGLAWRSIRAEEIPPGLPVLL